MSPETQVAVSKMIGAAVAAGVLYVAFRLLRGLVRSIKHLWKAGA